MLKKILFLSLSLFILVSFSQAAGAQDFSKVEIKTVPVRNSVYMLVGRGGNIGVSVGQDGVLMIDDQFAPLIPKIEAAIKKISSKPVKFVVNTHWHPDHTGGNEPLGKSGAVIVAQENVRKRLSTEQFSSFLKRKVPPSPQGAWPVITFTQDMVFHLNGEEIKIFHVDPAHTDGDAIIYFKKANVLHMGDVYMAGRYPFIDLNSGGSLKGVIAAVDRVLREIPADAKIIPGHGPLSNMEELKEYRKMLMTVRDRIRKLIKEGKTLPELIAAKPTADLDAKWGKGFLKPDGFVQIVYEGLKK